MRIAFLYRARNVLVLLVLATIVGLVCLWAKERQGASSSFQVHPQVFSMIQCWISDAECPVATEISLDAVEKNRNQFSGDEMKQEDGWTICREDGGKGFKRYRLIEKNGNHYKVEYQENGGGTLTAASIIGFSVEKRAIRKNGRPTTLRVLRVESCSSK